MLEISVIILIMVHMAVAGLLNWIAIKLNICSSLQIMLIYFVILSTYYLNLFTTFFKEYKNNPDLIEEIIREQLKIKKK